MDFAKRELEEIEHVIKENEEASLELDNSISCAAFGGLGEVIFG
jgi:hypothetical protein